MCKTEKKGGGVFWVWENALPKYFLNFYTIFLVDWKYFHVRLNLYNQKKKLKNVENVFRKCFYNEHPLHILYIKL